MTRNGQFGFRSLDALERNHEKSLACIGLHKTPHIRQLQHARTASWIPWKKQHLIEIDFNCNDSSINGIYAGFADFPTCPAPAAAAAALATASSSALKHRSSCASVARWPRAAAAARACGPATPDFICWERHLLGIDSITKCCLC